jgi:hypothetical protein
MPDKNDRLDVEVALKNREFELSLFWQRSNYFLVLNTALGVAAFSARTAAIGVLITLFGMLVCWLWYRTNLGSRFWHVFWESEVERLAPKYGLTAFELTMAQAKDRVRENIRPSESPWWRAFIDKGVLEKPSVTLHMIYLSLTALLFWFLILLFHVVTIVMSDLPEAPSPLSAPTEIVVPAPQNEEPSDGTVDLPSHMRQPEGQRTQ